MLASRRRVLTGAASLAITAAVGPAFAAMRPDDKFDLVIKGGEVLDPSQLLRGRRDIGIRYGVIEAVETSAATRARAPPESSCMGAAATISGSIGTE